MQRPFFESVQAYGQQFTDPAYWRPYVEEVCARHGLGACHAIRAGLPGTFPVFVVDGRYVVKLFGELFDGGTCFQVELEMYELLRSDPAIPAPSLVVSGTLFPPDGGWPWPYIVTEVIPGTSLAEVEEQVSFDDKSAICGFLGSVARHIHALQPERAQHLRLSWDAFDRFLSEQLARCVEHHRTWGSLPEHLVRQLPDYLPSLSELVDHSVLPHVLHCDLNADHVLGDFDGGHWRPNGIIDFGDAMAGDRVYELVALHIGLFRCDKRLLRVFLDAYGFDEGLRRDFVRRAMSMTLLHEFGVLSDVFPRFPGAAKVDRLDELAALLWDPECPGLPMR